MIAVTRTRGATRLFALLAVLTLTAASSRAQGLVYVDANDGFIGTQNLFPLSALNDIEAIEDDLWGYREDFGAGEVGNRYIYEAGGTTSGVEDVPEIYQTVSGLTPSTSYDLYAAYWTADGQNWTIRTGLASGDLTLYDRTGGIEGSTAGIPAANAVWTTPPTIDGATAFAEGDRIMLLGYAGTATVGASGEVNVYFDDLPNNDFSDRTWLDGVAFIPTGNAIAMSASINRNDGVLTLINGTGVAYEVTGLSVTSGSGALDSTGWLSVTDNYDSGVVDTNPWEITAPLEADDFTAALTELQSEGATGPGSLAAGQSLSLGSVWNDTRFEDVAIAVTLGDGTVLSVTPTYTGDAHQLGDFDNSGAVDLADYAVFTSNLHTDVSGLTQAEAYLRGDMNGDLAVDFNDFVAFRDAFPGSLAEALAVPEPSAGLLALVAAAALGRGSRRTRRVAVEIIESQTNTTKHRSTMKNPLPVLAATVALATGAAVAPAADVNLTGIDAFGTSSFVSAGLWSDNAAPSAGNDYFILTGTRLRTPADGESYTFGGDSLTIANTDPYPEGLMYKGTGNTGVITIPNLILDGGLINHANGTGDLFQLDGAVSVVSDSRLHAKQGTIDILAPVSGTANLTIIGADGPGRFLNLQGVNTFTGDIAVEAGASFGLGATGTMAFDIGANGVNNTVAGDGLAFYDGEFNFDLSGASTTDGDTWQITNVATQTFGDNFSIAGFSNLGDVLTNGTYVFDTATGALTVGGAPERLKLQVSSSGLIEITNDLVAEGADINYYEVRSSTGALIASGGGIDGDIPASTTSWEQAGGSTENLLSETNLQGSETLNLNDAISLGLTFAGEEADVSGISFSYGVVGGTELLGGYVEFVTVTDLAGDYNGDGSVDAADYVVWRNGGSPDSSQAGLDLWKANYGATSSTAASVPEPTTAVLVGVIGAAALTRRTR